MQISCGVFWSLANSISMWVVLFLYKGKVHLIWQGGDEDIEGGLRKLLDTRKGDSEKIRGGGSKNLYTSKPTGGGGS